MKNIYEIKDGKNWKYVLADSMKEVNNFCKINNISNWRVPGMLSRDEYKIIRETADII